MSKGLDELGGAHVYDSAADARDALDRLFRTFFDRSLAYMDAGTDTGESPAPGLAAAVTPGLGKTSTMLRLLAEVAPAVLREGHIAVYVPTHDLADRAHAEFTRRAPWVPAQVIRGRDAAHPVTGVRMCERPEVARRVAPIVPSVTQAICEGRPGRRAPCAVACPYLEQRPAQHSVLFLAHAYLAAAPPIVGPVVLQVIDEKAWPSLIARRDVTVEDWLRPPAAGLAPDLAARHDRLRFDVLDALQRGEPLVDRLRAAGLDREVLETLAAHEFETAPQLSLRPDMPRDVTRAAVEAFDVGLWSARTGRGRILRYLAGRVGSDRADRLTLAVHAGPTGRRDVLRLHKVRELSDIPTLFLDADADPRIVDALRPGTAYRSITVAPKATVVQAVDRTLSNAWLLDARKGAERREKVRAVVRREVARAGGGQVLLVATKEVLRALHADADGAAPQSDDALMQRLLGAHPRWFGPRLQGVNDYEGFDTVVLVGRLQPPVSEVETCARCLFGDGETPLTTLDAPVLWPRCAHRLFKDGARAVAEVRDHPDPRTSAVLRQFRECASLQAIARLRLVAPRKPKRVVLLGGLALPGLAIDHATTLDAIASGLETEPDVAGFRRLAQALGDGPRPAVRGLRLSVAGLAADLPAAFPTKAAAHAFRRGRPTDEVSRLIGRIAAARGWPKTDVTLTTDNGGRPIPAVVFAGEADARDAAVLWPELAPQSRV